MSFYDKLLDRVDAWWWTLWARRRRPRALVPVTPADAGITVTRHGRGFTITADPTDGAPRTVTWTDPGREATR